LARLFADGSLDRSFNAANGINGPVRGVAILGDGRLAIVGEFTAVGAVSRNRVALLQADGTLDATFDPGSGFDATVRALQIDTGNRLVCAGAFTQFAGVAAGRIVRLQLNGTRDETFNPGGAGANHEVHSLLRLGDGRFALGGKFWEFNGLTTRGIVLLDANGARDLSFSGNVWAESVDAILPLPAGRFLIGGNFAAEKLATYRYDLAILEADGTVDLAFNAGSGANFSNRVFTLADVGGGKILAGGDFSDFSGSGRKGLLVFNAATGVIESTPPVHAALHAASSDVNALVALPAGKLLAAGAFTDANGVSRAKAARFLPSGEIDPTFNANVALSSGYSVRTVLRREDGTLLLGTGTVVGTLENGTADPNWNVPADSDGSVNDLAEDSVGRVYVGGFFGVFGGATRYGLVRLLVDGQVDGTFPNSLPQYSFVDGLDLQADGKIVLAGQFYFPAGTIGLVRLNENGTVDSSFTAPAGTDEVDGVEVLADGRLIVAKRSATVGSTFRSGPFRLFPNGTIDPGFVSALTGLNSRVRQIVPLPDGRLLVSGDDFSAGTVSNPSQNPRQGIAILNEDGSLASFHPGTRPLFDVQNTHASVRTVAIDSADRIHGGGRIAEFQWSGRAGLVRLSTAPELEVELTGLAPVNSLVGQAVTLTATAAALEGTLVGVFFEGSRDGGPFVPVASGTPQGGDIWTGTWKPDYDGTWLLRAVATDLRARRLASTTLSAETLLPPTDFEEWADANFTAGELLDPLLSGPEADPDKDGHKNLDEYFSDSLPKHPGSLPALTANSFEVGSQNFPGLVYRARKNATDLSVVVEVSSNLEDWDDNPSLTLLVSRSPDGLGFELVRVRTTSVGGARTFLRRRLTQIP